MEIRRAGADDVGLITDMRLAFVAEHRGVAVSRLGVRFAAATKEWIDRLQRSGRLLTWLAEADGHCIGVTTVVLHDLPPRPADHRVFDGRLLNVWVVPAARGCGIGRALVEACLSAAADLGVRSFSLHATPEGRPLYEDVGFTSGSAWMERRAGEHGGGSWRPQPSPG